MSGNAGVWDSFSAGWYSGANTSILLSIVDANYVAGGKDFGLDGISLVNTGLTAPELSTWAMMGSALRALLTRVSAVVDADHPPPRLMA